MVQLGYLILWAFAGFGLLVAASFVGTMLALQYYNSGGTLSVSLDDSISRLNNDKP